MMNHPYGQNSFPNLDFDQIDSSITTRRPEPRPSGTKLPRIIIKPTSLGTAKRQKPALPAMPANLKDNLKRDNETYRVLMNARRERMPMPLPADVSVANSHPASNTRIPLYSRTITRATSDAHQPDREKKAEFGQSDVGAPEVNGQKHEAAVTKL